MNESSLEETKRSRQRKGKSRVAARLPRRRYSRQKYQVISDQTDY